MNEEIKRITVFDLLVLKELEKLYEMGIREIDVFSLSEILKADRRSVVFSIKGLNNKGIIDAEIEYDGHPTKRRAEIIKINSIEDYEIVSVRARYAYILLKDL